jgi:hypothetical protein
MNAWFVAPRPQTKNAPASRAGCGRSIQAMTVPVAATTKSAFKA